MKANVKKTMDNIKSFLETSGHNHSAEMFGREKGFISQAEIQDRLFWFVFRINEKLDALVVEIYPEVNCCEAYRAQTSEFIMRKNSANDLGNIRINRCGSVYLHFECGIENEPVSEDYLEMLECNGLKVLCEVAGEIDCLAHGRLFRKDVEN